MAVTRFDLPDGWEWSTLGELTSHLRRGRGPKYTQEPTVPVINQKCIRWGYIDTQWIKYATRAHYASLPSEHVLRDGDLLWNSTGVGTIGRAAVYKNSGPTPTICDSHVTIVRPIKILPEYLFYWIWSDHVQNNMDALNAGSTGQIELSRTEAMDLSVPVAPLSEQRRIVEKIEALLSDIANGVENLDAVDRKLGIFRRSVLHAAISGKLTEDWRSSYVFPSTTGGQRLEKFRASRSNAAKEIPTALSGRLRSPRKVEETLDLPETWATAFVEEIGFIESGQTPKGIAEKCNANGDVPWFKVSSMNETGNETELYSSKWNIIKEDAAELGVKVRPKGTIVFPKRGGAILTDKKRFLGKDGAYDLNVMGVVPIGDVGAWLRLFFEYIDLSQIQDGSNVPQINYDDVALLKVPVPSKDEQDEIIGRVDVALLARRRTSTETEEIRRKASNLRRTILNSALTGRLVQQDPNDEPATQLLARIRAERAQAPKTSGRRGRPRKRSRTSEGATP